MSAAMILMPHQVDQAKEQLAALEQKMRGREAQLLNLEAQRRRLEESRAGYAGNREKWLRLLNDGDERAMRKIEVAEREILDCDRRLEAVKLAIATAKTDSNAAGEQLRDLGRQIAAAERSRALDAAAKDLEAKAEAARRLTVELALVWGSVARAQRQMAADFGDEGRRRSIPIVSRAADQLADTNSRTLAPEETFGTSVPRVFTLRPMRKATS